MLNKDEHIKEANSDCCLDQNYWEQRWKSGNTGWDIGHPSVALEEYIKQYTKKDAQILIPGCGSAYEAEVLLSLSFTNIHLLDISPKIVKKVQEKFSESPQIKVICGDYFNHHDLYDLIIEQTFFCALSPSLRNKYVTHTYNILKPEGRVIGLLFNKQFDQSGPPYGGSEEEYRKLFSPYFKIQTMEVCYNSISPRQNSELFINLIKS